MSERGEPAIYYIRAAIAPDVLIPMVWDAEQQLWFFEQPMDKCHKDILCVAHDVAAAELPAAAREVAPEVPR
jgi:hypothetical protein